MAHAHARLAPARATATNSVAAAIRAHQGAWDTLVDAATAALGVHPPIIGDARRRGARNQYDALTDVLMRIPISTLPDLTLFSRYVASLRAHGGSAWPVGYPVQVWHLTAAVENMAETLARLSPPR